MNTLVALNIAIGLMDTMAHMAETTQRIANLIAKAKSEGREDLTPEEWATVAGGDDAARVALAAAIAKALRA